MNLLNTTRARLLAGALVLLASFGLTLTSTRDADAQRAIPWERTPAWAQYCQGWPRSGNASTNLPATVERSLADLGNRNASNEVLRQALDVCRLELSRDRRHNIHAYLCVGQANLMDTVPQHSAQQAYCAYHSAALLARNNAGLRSRAHIGRARALEVVGSPTDVINAYNAAIVADRNASEARIALARYYVGRREWAEARGLLVRQERESGRLVPVVSSTESALAIIDLARASTRPDSADYLALVNAAQTAVAGVPGGNVGVNSALGAAYFERNRPEARRYLWLATEGAVAQSPTEVLLQLDAYYYRSIIEAEEGNFTQAVRHADQAGASQHAMRQACLVRLMMAGDQIYRLSQDSRGRVTDINPSREGQLACERLGSAPEGPLLEGMFWLRYSQFRAAHFNPQAGELNARLWRDAVNRADQAFARGKTAVGDDTRTLLGWPGAETIARSQSPITLRAMYGYADDLGDYFGRFCDRNSQMNLTPEERQVEPLFVYYRVVRGPENDYRCGPA